MADKFLVTIFIKQMKKTAALTHFFNIKYPVIQAAMLGVSTPGMAAAISNQGGLGSVAAGNMSQDRTLALINETRKLTNKPFAVNLFINEIPSIVRSKEFYAMQSFLVNYCERNGIPYDVNIPVITQHTSYKDQLEVLLQENIEIVSFTFGILDDSSINLLKSNGTKLMGTATSVAEAELLQKQGIDIIIAQGMEAGGHSGSFLNPSIPQKTTNNLIKDLLNTIGIPILAAGGISDRKSYKAAIDSGASGIVAGSIFVSSYESMANDQYKTYIQSQSNNITVFTKAFSGKWARAIKNNFITAIEDSKLPIPNFTEQQILTAQIRSFAIKNNRCDIMPMWAGKFSFKSQKGAASDIMMLLLTDDTITETITQTY